jgi:uncharacterized protein YndB with AHSA1/START domain
VRYEDGPTAEAEVLIDAPAMRVWALVTDIDLPSRFSSEFQGADWIDDGPALGARFVGRNEHRAMGGWQTTCTVTELEPQRTFGWAVEDPAHPAATWRFELEERPDGVRLAQRVRIGPGPSGLSMVILGMPEKEERIVARRLEEFERNMRSTLEGIKALAEAGP